MTPTAPHSTVAYASFWLSICLLLTLSFSLDAAPSGEQGSRVAAAKKAGDFSVSLWVKSASTSEGHLIQERSGNTETGQYQLTQNSDGTVSFFVFDGGNKFSVTSTDKVNDDAWHLVVAVRDGNEGKLYIDGVLAAQGADAVKGSAGGQPSRGNSDYSGVVDDARSHNSALSEDDAIALMTNRAPSASSATFTIADNVAVDSTVGTLAIVDANAEDQHTFSITAGNSAGVFSIDSAGRIATAGDLDYNTASQYILTITFFDNGVPALSGSATVTVNITPADSDIDGMIDAWEMDNFTNITTANSTTDADGDGQKDVAEYKAGTNPNSASDVLAITEFVSTRTDAMVKWSVKNGKSYTIKYSYDLITWNDVVTGQVSSANSTMAYLDTDATRAAAPKVFYKVEVE